MKILITGGAGFIGSNLCKKLLSTGYEVVVLDNFITSDKSNLVPLLKNPKFTFIEHDIVKPFPEKFTIHNSQFTVVFHLACPTGVPNLTKLAEEMLLTCSIGTKNVLELARKQNAKVVFTSSSEVYGNPAVFPQTEDYTGNVNPTGIRSPYEEGKRFSESLLLMYVRKYKLDAKIVRVFNTYGPGMNFNDTRVVPKFIKSALFDKPLPVEGSGKQTRTFCYVDDLVNGLLIVMKKGKTGEVYNLGSNKETSIRKLPELIIKHTLSKSTIQFVKRPSHDHEGRCPDLDKITKLGWELTVPLEEGLRKTIQWYKEEKILS